MAQQTRIPLQIVSLQYIDLTDKIQDKLEQILISVCIKGNVVYENRPEIARMQVDLININKQLTEIKTQISTLHKQISLNQDEEIKLAEAQNAKSKLEEIEELQSAKDEYQAHYDEQLQEKLDNSNNKLRELTLRLEEFTTLTKNIEHLQKKLDEEPAIIVEIERLQSIDEVHQELVDELENVNSKIVEIEKKLDELYARRQNIKSEIESTLLEKKELSKLQDFHSEIQVIKAELPDKLAEKEIFEKVQNTNSILQETIRETKKERKDHISKRKGLGSRVNRYNELVVDLEILQTKVSQLPTIQSKIEQLDLDQNEFTRLKQVMNDLNKRQNKIEIQLQNEMHLILPSKDTHKNSEISGLEILSDLLDFSPLLGNSYRISTKINRYIVEKDLLMPFGIAILLIIIIIGLLFTMNII